MNYFQALPLVKAEPTKGDALEIIAKLAESGQISEETEERLQDYVSETLFVTK